MGVNGTSIVADATENIRNNVRVQTMSKIFDTEGYVVWMNSDGKLRRIAASRMDQSVFIAAQCEIQSEKRIGKEEIDTDYGENRRKEPVQVSVRISCNQDLGNNIK